MNTTFVSVAAVAAILIILAVVVWKVTHKNPDITNVDLPEITPEEIAQAAAEAAAGEAEAEKVEEPAQTVEDYVTEVASKLVDSEGSLTSTKLETEGQDTVLVISDRELAEANKKFEESLKIIGINPVTGCYTPAESRKTEKTAKPAKSETKKDTKKKSEKKEEKKETVKVNKSGRPIKKIEKKPAGKKNNDARQNKAVNGKKNKKKTNKKKV